MVAGMPAEGLYRMFKPIRSTRGYFIVGGVTGGKHGRFYTKRVWDAAKVRSTHDMIHKKILSDNPGIKPVIGGLH